MSVQVTVKSTGEVYDFPSDTPDEVVESYRLVNEYIKTLERAKNLLQTKASDVVGPDGTYEHDGYMLRVSNIQRMTYDKSLLRELLDEDTFDLMLEPAKTRIDNYLRENLEDLGDISHQLRESMVPVGKPYRVIKLERLEVR